MGKHKHVVCEKCFRVMRSDHLERHMKQHENGKFEAESLSGSSFSASTTSLESNFSSVSTARSCKPILINEEAVLKTMDMHAEEYEGKLKLGEIVYNHVKGRRITFLISMFCLFFTYKSFASLYSFGRLSSVIPRSLTWL